jgi:hypothetical protein
MKTEYKLHIATFIITLLVSLFVALYSTSTQIEMSKSSTLSHRIDSLKELLEITNKTEQYEDILIEIEYNYVIGNYTESERLIEDIPNEIMSGMPVVNALNIIIFILILGIGVYLARRRIKEHKK